MTIGSPSRRTVRSGSGNLSGDTMSGDETLTVADSNVQLLDPAAARNLDLPAAPAGCWVEVHNLANGVETITVRDDNDDTIATVAQNESKLFTSTGSAWIAGSDLQAATEAHGA